MKLCVFSDSHGNAENMIAAIRRENPLLYFFLGDGERDLALVREEFPFLPFYAVRGNCDPRSKLSEAVTCAVGSVGIFAVHGHRHNVKYEAEPETLAAAARAEGAEVALFGHTHRPFCGRVGEVLAVNPGSVGRGAHPGYAVLILEDGGIRAELKTL